jgi:hypothetical protein
MKEPKEVSQLKLAAQVSKHVQIEDVRLIQMSGRVYPQPSEAVGGTAHLEQTHKAKFRRTGADLSIEVHFDLRGVHKDGDDKKIFSLRAAFELTYRLDKEVLLSHAELLAFSHVNGLFNAWPYWREFVQNTAARMALPGLVVPVFRVPRAPSAKREPKETTKGISPVATLEDRSGPEAHPSNT